MLMFSRSFSSIVITGTRIRTELSHHWTPIMDSELGAGLFLYVFWEHSSLIST